MNKTTKTLTVLFSAGLIMVLSSCTSSHKGTGCPGWSKVKYEQPKKKSV